MSPAPVLTIEEAMRLVGDLRAENSSLKIRLTEMERLVNLKTCTTEEVLQSIPRIPPSNPTPIVGMLSLEDARRKGLCRICGETTTDTPITMNFGAEWAHTSCLPPEPKKQMVGKSGGYISEDWRI